jgi:glutathione peroxidase
MRFHGVRNNVTRGSDELDFAQAALRDKLVLLVNTASLCGFTPQLAGLQKLHEKYGPRGLVVLAVPSNDFGEQEPGSNEEVIAFYKQRYGVSFPVTAKARVIGPHAHPVYRGIEATLGEAGTPSWNFQKHAIKNGQIVGLFPPDADPMCAEIVETIEEQLPSPAVGQPEGQ